MFCDSKIYLENQLRTGKIILIKNKVGGLILCNVKTYSKATVIKAVWYWQKDRHILINQRDRKESRNRSPQIQSTDLWRRYKDNLFKKWYWDNWMSIYKKMNLDTYLTSYTKMYSKKTMALNIKHESIELLDENLCDLRLAMSF